jgi:hypothetical protein
LSKVNYRGSNDFDARFLRAGMNGQFHKALQSDIVDAVKYATGASAGENTDSEVDIPPRPWGDPHSRGFIQCKFIIRLPIQTTLQLFAMIRIQYVLNCSTSRVIRRCG